MSRFRMSALVAALALTAACGGGEKPTRSLNASVDTIQAGVTDNQVDTSRSVYKITKGRDVRLNIYSSATDQVHVHGYEKTAPVAAGTIVTIEFTADKAGLFSVDMARSHVKLFQLKVS